MEKTNTDHRQRKVLRQLNKMRRQPFSELELRNKTKIFDRDKLVALCRDLEKKGYLSVLSVSQNNEIKNIKLSYRGMQYKEDHRRHILERSFDWFTQNLVGLAALIVSVIALLQGFR